MKNLETANKKLVGFGILAVVIAFLYLGSDIFEYFGSDKRFMFDLNILPLYRRIPNYVYTIILAIGGFSLLKKKIISWDIFIIYASSRIINFFVSALSWGIIFSTNWMDDYLIILIYSIFVIIFCLKRHGDFRCNNALTKLMIYILINAIIIGAHELLFLYIV